jgi:hypothetical protein
MKLPSGRDRRSMGLHARFFFFGAIARTEGLKNLGLSPIRCMLH